MRSGTIRTICAPLRPIQQFLATFLTSPDGAFYTSQDADVVEGQHSAEYFALDDQSAGKQAYPRVDTHIYARENGWAITALASLYEVTGDPKTLDEAMRAADWVTQHRALRRERRIPSRRQGCRRPVPGRFHRDDPCLSRALPRHRATASG